MCYCCIQIRITFTAFAIGVQLETNPALAFISAQSVDAAVLASMV